MFDVKAKTDRTLRLPEPTSEVTANSTLCLLTKIYPNMILIKSIYLLFFFKSTLAQVPLKDVRLEASSLFTYTPEQRVHVAKDFLKVMEVILDTKIQY